MPGYPALISRLRWLLVWRVGIGAYQLRPFLIRRRGFFSRFSSFRATDFEAGLRPIPAVERRFAVRRATVVSLCGARPIREPRPGMRSMTPKRLRHGDVGDVGASGWLRRAGQEHRPPAAWITPGHDGGTRRVHSAPDGSISISPASIAILTSRASVRASSLALMPE